MSDDLKSVSLSEYVVELRAERDQLKAKCERLEGELHQCQEDRQSSGVIADNMIALNERLESQAAQMREVLEQVQSAYLLRQHDACLVAHALSTTAGTAILARLEEARRLLEDCDGFSTKDNWFNRRDQWLKGQP